MREIEQPRLHYVERSIDGDKFTPARATLIVRGSLVECLIYMKTVPKKHRSSHAVFDPDGRMVSGDQAAAWPKRESDATGI